MIDTREISDRLVADLDKLAVVYALEILDEALKPSQRRLPPKPKPKQLKGSQRPRQLKA